MQRRFDGCLMVLLQLLKNGSLPHMDMEQEQLTWCWFSGFYQTRSEPLIISISGFVLTHYEAGVTFGWVIRALSLPILHGRVVEAELVGVLQTQEHRWSVNIMTHAMRLQARLPVTAVVVWAFATLSFPISVTRAQRTLTFTRSAPRSSSNLFLFLLTGIVASGQILHMSSWRCQRWLAVTCCLGKQGLVWHMQTYHIGAFGLEGVGAAGVEVRVVVALQEADVVEAFGLWQREELLENISPIKTNTSSDILVLLNAGQIRGFYLNVFSMGKLQRHIENITQ